MVIHVIDVSRLRPWQLRESEIWPNNFVEAFPGVSDRDAGKHLGTGEVVRSAQFVGTPPTSGGGQVLQ